MSAGMAEVVAAHDFLPMSVSCLCGNWAWDGTASKAYPHAAHIAEELTKAGYGKLGRGEDEECDFGNPDPVEVPAQYARPTGVAPFLARFADEISQQPVVSADDLGRMGVQRHSKALEAPHGVD